MQIATFTQSLRGFIWSGYVGIDGGGQGTSQSSRKQRTENSLACSTSLWHATIHTQGNFSVLC